MIKKISTEQYLQIAGLLALAEVDIESSIHSVLEVNKDDEDKSGVGDPQHVGDAIYSGYSADTLLKKLGIVKTNRNI